MKPRQLANVLIKILGISLILHAIPGFLTGVFVELFGFWLGLAGSPTKSSTSGVSLAYPLASGLSAIIVLVIAIILIAWSRKIAGFLFKDEDD